MENNHHNYFAEIDLPEGLSAAVHIRIEKLERKAALIKVSYLGSLSAISGFALVPLTQYTMREFYTSGFYDYASLLFSDVGFVFSHGREFALILIESLPSLAVLLYIVFVGGFVWSVVRVVRSAKIAFPLLSNA